MSEAIEIQKPGVMSRISVHYLAIQRTYAHRKQLAIAGMNELSKVWIRKDHIHESVRLDFYNYTD